MIDTPVTATPAVAKARLVRNTPVKVLMNRRFSYKQLQQLNKGVEYITLYMRVRRALKNGTLVVDGTTRGHKGKRKGRSAVMYKSTVETI
jgi:hypothetical protein